MLKFINHSFALKLDSIAFFASAVCAVHCAAIPFVILTLSLYGFHFIANPLIEFTIIGSSAVIGAFTFSHGYFKHHKNFYPVIFFLFGFALIIIGHLFSHSHSQTDSKDIADIIFYIISPLGAIAIAIAHFVNRKLTKGKASKVCSC